MEELLNDLKNLGLPRDLDVALPKIQCSLKQGCRVWWYAKEDKDMADEMGEDPRSLAPYSGILVAAPDTTYNGSELEIEDCVIVMDNYPVEKCYPEVSWIALNRLLDNEDLVEIFTDKDPKRAVVV